MDEAKWLQRIIFLETVAGVPGMVSSLLTTTRLGVDASAELLEWVPVAL